MKFARIVTVFGRSGLTNAYRSVLSATGSFEMPGASRCDDMGDPPLCLGVRRVRERSAVGGADDPSCEVGVAMHDLLVPDHQPHLAARALAHVREDRLGCVG